MLPKTFSNEKVLSLKYSEFFEWFLHRMQLYFYEFYMNS